MLINATNLKNEKTNDLNEVKKGLENQLNNGQLRPWEKTIAEMHLDDIEKELKRRAEQ